MRTKILGALGLAAALAVVAFVRGDGGGSDDPTAYRFAGGDDRIELARGEWRVVSLNVSGTELAKDQLEARGMHLMFKDGTLRSKNALAKNMAAPMPLTLQPDSSPKQIEWQTKARKILGIYQLDGDTLKIAIAIGQKTRPTDFTPGPDKTVYVLKRVAP
jgi:uncharacterized protein (TIGR03067 family)